MTAIPFAATPAPKPRASQSQLRAVVGIALLSLTIGTQLLWSILAH